MSCRCLRACPAQRQLSWPAARLDIGSLTGCRACWESGGRPRWRRRGQCGSGPIGRTTRAGAPRSKQARSPAGPLSWNSTAARRPVPPPANGPGQRCVARRAGQHSFTVAASSGDSRQDLVSRPGPQRRAQHRVARLRQKAERHSRPAFTVRSHAPEDGRDSAAACDVSNRCGQCAARRLVPCIRS